MNIIERDKIYARKVYEAYTKTESLKEYAEEIKRISNESGISEKYLRSLLEEYEQTATKEEIEIIERVKARNAKRVYIEFVENITCLNDEEIKEQIMSKKFKKSEVDKRFKDYLEKIKDQEKLEKAKKVYDYVTRIYDEIDNENKRKIEGQHHDRVIELFNKIVDEGYITVKAFARENHNKYGMDQKQFMENLNRLKKYLKERNEYKYYEERLNANRLSVYEKLESKIERMIKELPDNYEKVSCENSYDIIDYYLEIGMNPNTFIELCEGTLMNKN